MNKRRIEEYFLLRNKISRINLEKIFEIIKNKKIEYTDLYFQSKNKESWILENKIIKKGNYVFDEGVGIRSFSGEKTGLFYTNEISYKNLKKGIEISSIVEEKSTKPFKKIVPFFVQKNKEKYLPFNPVRSIKEEEKINLLNYIDKYARKLDRRVTEVFASITTEFNKILIISSEGLITTDFRPMTLITIKVQIEENGKIEQGYSGLGSRCKYDNFIENSSFARINKWIEKSVRSALLNLFAKEAPSGNIPVVLGPGWPGILLHEAVGHGLEGDFNRKKSSIFSDKLGKLVASEICTVVDNGTIFGNRGSLTIDDEGTPSQYNILIQNGVLKKYMQDKLNAKLMNTVSTGNGRRESYAHIPIPRMTNTYILPGNFSPKEIIETIEFGIYATNFSGGQVDISSGNFVFSTSDTFLIQKGKIKHPIKKVTLIGTGIEVMKKISMIGNDLCLDSGLGNCGKEGQIIPVNVGQPTLKIDSITVGGTKSIN
ncbi:metalloprotease TldD [bacterium endosymbiont of Pedicinus badii]|uniref:metalloprotease TldD n=1 Tax=bacterium endosymbiont of Pedicinus badii TaxID=1719126 RepID=UPI0009BA75E1|nr:metalloprotease TldD [bacterium endosymbiont of Pedicinus badii]OQM34028.1 protease TldD [bacterium endosymbiont of Pedicinus badii]